MKLLLLLSLIAPINSVSANQVAPSNQITNQVQTTSIPYKCSTKAFKFLKGRALSDVMATQLPPNTRIYRFGDHESQFEKIAKNRLNIEIDDNTFVRRVYCS